MNRLAVDWQKETKIYERPHPRLAAMAQVIRALPHRRILDAGCSTGTLETLLPRDFAYYGCDVTDHAQARLAPGRFRQIDFNRSSDLSAFAGEGIDMVHIGGVLEYLDRPQEFLRSTRQLVAGVGRLVVSIINFQSFMYRGPRNHHLGWIYKPVLEELRQALADTGWAIERQMPFFGPRRLGTWLANAWSERLGVDHPLTRRRAQQFILQARAR